MSELSDSSSLACQPGSVQLEVPPSAEGYSANGDNKPDNPDNPDNFDDNKVDKLDNKVDKLDNDTQHSVSGNTGTSSQNGCQTVVQTTGQTAGKNTDQTDPLEHSGMDKPSPSPVPNETLIAAAKIADPHERLTYLEQKRKNSKLELDSIKVLLSAYDDKIKSCTKATENQANRIRGQIEQIQFMSKKNDAAILNIDAQLKKLEAERAELERQREVLRKDFNEARDKLDVVITSEDIKKYEAKKKTKIEHSLRAAKTLKDLEDAIEMLRQELRKPALPNLEESGIFDEEDMLLLLQHPPQTETKADRKVRSDADDQAEISTVLSDPPDDFERLKSVKKKQLDGRKGRLVKPMPSNSNSDDEESEEEGSEEEGSEDEGSELEEQDSKSSESSESEPEDRLARMIKKRKISDSAKSTRSKRARREVPEEEFEFKTNVHTGKAVIGNKSYEFDYEYLEDDLVRVVFTEPKLIKCLLERFWYVARRRLSADENKRASWFWNMINTAVKEESDVTKWKIDEKIRFTKRSARGNPCHLCGETINKGNECAMGFGFAGEDKLFHCTQHPHHLHCAGFINALMTKNAPEAYFVCMGAAQDPNKKALTGRSAACKYLEGKSELL